MSKPPKIVIPGMNRGAGVQPGTVLGRRRGRGKGPVELLDTLGLRAVGVATLGYVQQLIAAAIAAITPAGSGNQISLPIFFYDEGGEEPWPMTLPGTTGATGATGATGSQGAIGMQGLDGDLSGEEIWPLTLPGTAGATGPVGPAGPAGPQGPAGVQGLDGDFFSEEMWPLTLSTTSSSSGPDIEPSGWLPLVSGAEPPVLISDGAGDLITVAYAP